MPLLFNGNKIERVLCNGTELQTLQINGNVVWTKTEAPAEVPSGTVIFSSNVAGNSQFIIEAEGNYNVRVVGAGGGGAAWLDRWGTYANGWRASVAAGGSGGYFYGTVLLQPGIYTTVIGKGGDGKYSLLNSNTAQRPSSPASVMAGNGGESYVSGISGTWLCSGGTGGYCGYGFANAGIGGAGDTKNGYNGGSYFTNSGEQTASPFIDIYATGGSALYKTYGAGGRADSEYYSNGPSWLVKGTGGNHGFIEVIKS